MAENDRAGPGGSAEQVSAGRDAYVAGRDLVITNSYLPSETGEVSAAFHARVNQAAEELAVVVGDEWRREERHRRVQDPGPAAGLLDGRRSADQRPRGEHPA